MYINITEVLRKFSTSKTNEIWSPISKIFCLQIWVERNYVRCFVYKYAMANHLTLSHQWIESELSCLQWTRDFTKKHKKEILLRKS